jgi:rubrerythrin
MRPYDVEMMIKIYGDIKLSELLEKLKGNKKFICPKCKGKGTVSIKYDAYPTGLPDSGWVSDWQYKDVDCDVCKGHGYTEKQMKPKYEFVGYEET